MQFRPFTIEARQAAAALFANCKNLDQTIETMAVQGFDGAVVSDFLADMNRDFERRHLIHPGVAPTIVTPVNPTPSGDAAVYFNDQARPRLVFNYGNPFRVAYYDNFLTEQECDHMLAMAGDNFTQSQVVESDTSEAISASRSSQTAHIALGADPVIQTIEARIALYFSWPVQKAEPMQVIKYQPGQEYKAHFDHFDGAEGPNKYLANPEWQRTATLIMYLQDCDIGGSTSFPNLGLTVAPKRGSAVFFNYGDPKLRNDMLHSGDPVRSGVKIIATKWFKTLEYKG